MPLYSLPPHQPPQLPQDLENLLLDLSANPYPHVPNPPTAPKRASVALVIRVRPHYDHRPPPTASDLNNVPSESTVIEPSLKPTERIEQFFRQDWVAHGEPEVLFIKRAHRPGDRWTSHVALPGGRRDPEDEDDRAAAVRETWEEVGLELSERNSIFIGNLPERVVTTSWGKIPLMVLCPYIFLLTIPTTPPLSLQPTEVGSTHWVSLQALLSPSQRTFEKQDVTARLAKTSGKSRLWALRLMLGKMLFAAIRLIPSESVYATEQPGFLPSDPISEDSSVASRISHWWNKGRVTDSGPDKPLLLWGLTLGVIADLLELLPPYDALELWTYPTFTPWDIRFALWAMSYNFRTQKAKELEEGATAPVAVEGGLDNMEVPKGTPSPEVTRLGGLGVGGYWGKVRLRQRGARSSAVGLLLEGYYEYVRKAVTVALAGRLSLVVILGAISYRRWRNGQA